MRRVAIIFLFISVYGLPAVEVEIPFRSAAGAHHAEINWLTSDQNLQGEVPDSLTEEVKDSPLRAVVEDKYRYFRLRSVSEEGIAGPWGKVLKVADFPRKEIKVQAPDLIDVSDTSGRTEKYLKPLELDLRRDLPAEYKISYILTAEGEKAPTDEKEQAYSTPLPLQKEGAYHITVIVRDAAGVEQLKRDLEFHIDRTPPKVEARLYPPFHTDGGRNWYSPASYLLFFTRDAASGTEEVFCRALSGKTPEPDFIPCGRRFELSGFGKRISPDLKMEYYAVDRVGNRSATAILSFALDSLGPRVVREEDERFVRFRFGESNPPITIEGEGADGKKIEWQGLQSWNIDKQSDEPVPVKMRLRDALGNLTDWPTQTESDR